MLGVRQQDEGSFASEASLVGGACKCAWMWVGLQKGMLFFVFNFGCYLSPTVFFILAPNELLDVTAYGLRSDFLSPETMPKATVELALTKNRKLLLACMLGAGVL